VKLFALAFTNREDLINSVNGDPLENRATLFEKVTAVAH